MGILGIFSRRGRLKRQMQKADALYEGFASELAECPGPNLRFEVVTNRWGKVLQSGWKYYDPPDQFERDGLQHTRSYVKQLVESDHWWSIVSIFATEGEGYIMLEKMEGAIFVSLSISKTHEPGRERRARDFFASLGIQPEEDYEVKGCSRNEDTQCIEWPVIGDADQLTDTLLRAASEIYSITNEDPLELHFEEPEDDRDASKAGVRLYSFSPDPEPDETA